MAGGLLLSQTKRAIIFEFQLMTAFHQRDGFDQVTEILRPFFPRAAARSLIWTLSCSCKYSLILVFIDLFAGYPASFFLSICVFVLQNKNRQRHCLSLSYLLESTIKIIAINNQKKIIIAVKRCITASNPRAFERSNKSFELASKTLLDWFLLVA